MRSCYRRRWCVEGMFQRLEAALQSEIRSLGHPRAALLGFAVAVLAYNVLAVLQRCIEQVVAYEVRALLTAVSEGHEQTFWMDCLILRKRVQAEVHAPEEVWGVDERVDRRRDF